MLLLLTSATTGNKIHGPTPAMTAHLQGFAQYVRRRWVLHLAHEAVAAAAAVATDFITTPVISSPPPPCTEPATPLHPPPRTPCCNSINNYLQHFAQNAGLQMRGAASGP
jgi:hypothetical protein